MVKKGRKKKDDFWEEAETKNEESSEDEKPQRKAGFGFSMLDLNDDEEAKPNTQSKDVETNSEEEVEAIVIKAKKSKKKNKNTETIDSLDDLEITESIPSKPTKKKKKDQNFDDFFNDELSEKEDVPKVEQKSAKQKLKEKKDKQKLEKKLQAQKEAELLASTPPKVEEKSPPKPKPKKEKEPKPKPEPSKRKGPAGLGALRKALEEQQALEEEQKRLDEERRLKEEEEERILQEKLAKEKEETDRKKAQAKAEKEMLKKEGKLLTKAQQKAKEKSETKLKQMLESGVKIQGLESENKRPDFKSFNKKRNKQGVKAEETKKEEIKEIVNIEENKEDVKVNWDDSEEEVKDNWDDGSDSDKEPKSAEVPPKKEPSPKPETFKAKAESPIEKQEWESGDSNLRSPICCILGHVDTGKTKLLDKIRQTNVQEGEAGGITQQIGATYFPIKNINQKTQILKDYRMKTNPKLIVDDLEYKLPGLLIIDTPGHESFTNLRTRGSSLCNIAVLVVDIMHGLEQQTLESIRLLRDRKTPFVVALNKIDRLYGWQPEENNCFLDSLSKQNKSVRKEFDNRVESTITLFAEQGLNAIPYYDNKNFAKYVSLVPTSAITGEGIPDLLDLLITLTQTRMSSKLMYLSKLECTVLEVKMIEGLGTTIDVVLSNGVLNEGDKIVVCGLNGPIVTQIRALLTPQPMRELRIKSQYVHHKYVKAALGVKISANDLEKAIAGSRLLVIGPNDNEDDLMDEVMEDLQTLLNSVDTSGKGVCVQASTIGSLEALLQFLNDMKIPVSGVNIGPIYKKDILRAATMVDKAKEFAVILAFDVKVDKDAQELAKSMGVTIFEAEIIYHLFDKFTEYYAKFKEDQKDEVSGKAVFPGIYRIIPGAVFNKKDPLIVGVNIVEGTIRVGTPICVAPIDPETKKRLPPIVIGTVTGLEMNHKQFDIVKRGQEGAGVAVKIESIPNTEQKLIGRNFSEQDELFSRITRESIDVLKKFFREDVSKEGWALIVKLKSVLGVV